MGTRTDLPYTQAKTLMSAPELEMFHALSRLFSYDYLIFVKPRFEDFIHVGRGIIGTDRWHYRNHIKSRHADFLICSKDIAKPIMAIELDDSSHNTQKVIERDQLMDNICASAGLKYIHIPISKRNDENYLREVLDIKDFAC